MARQLLVLPVLLSALAGPAGAEPSTHVAWTPETLALVKNAKPEHGQELAKSLGCDTCHASNGMPEAPQLSGQSANYLYRQLYDYKDGSRSDDAMSPMVGSLSEQAMADLAAWYGRQAPLATTPAKGDTAAGRKLAEQGDNQRMLPACSACHGGNGQGQAQDIPRLSGQKAAYLAAALQAYKTGERHNDVYSRMRTIVQPLSEEEIRQLAHYYAGLEN